MLGHAIGVTIFRSFHTLLRSQKSPDLHDISNVDQQILLQAAELVIGILCSVMSRPTPQLLLVRISPATCLTRAVIEWFEHVSVVQTQGPNAVEAIRVSDVHASPSNALFL